MLGNESGKFEISGAGVLLLGAATLVASGIVFLLGVYVGKGMVEQRLAQDNRVVRLPVLPPGTPGPGSEVDVTFWDKLAKGGEAGSPAPAAPTPTAVETPVRVVPSPPATEPTEPTAAAPTPAPTKPPARSDVLEGSGRYQVQVNAMADKNRADALAHDLKTLGFTPYISPAKVGKRTLYRVRVSNLGSEQAAKQAVARLREQGYPSAFLVAEASGR